MPYLRCLNAVFMSRKCGIYDSQMTHLELRCKFVPIVSVKVKKYSLKGLEKKLYTCVLS